jgi:hypothetical protein
MLQRTLTAGFIAPCLPTKAHRPPSGGQWIHEIKHDGFRIVARKNGSREALHQRAARQVSGTKTTTTYWRMAPLSAAFVGSPMQIVRWTRFLVRSQKSTVS